MKRHVTLLLSAVALAACSPGQNSANTVAAPDAAVVGGQEIAMGSPLAQSTVGIYEKEIGYICTGTLITSNLVLTAGHCVDPKAKDLNIYFSEKIKGAPADRVRKVVASVVHPNYSTEMKAKDMGDIAILKFEGDVPSEYTPAKLMGDGSKLFNGRDVFVAGYGLNWTIGISRGAGTLRATALKIDDATYSATEAELGQSVRKGICSGDSGGPAYLMEDGQLYVWGVASRGDSLPIPLVPKCMMFSVFTRVDAYQNWIVETVNQLNQQ